MPLVSIVINCYNGDLYLKEAIDSILSQTIIDWEIIFWDNGSTDTSRAIVLSYKDNRIRYFFAPTTTPLSTARNLALRESKGQWIAFLDVDDIWFPNKLEMQISRMEGTDYVLCYAGIRETTPSKKKIRDVYPRYKSGWMVEQQIAHYDINMVTPLIRKSFLDLHYLNFEPGLTCYADQNLFVRIAAKGKICAINEILGIWRISPGSLSDQTIEFWASERRFNLRQLRDENPGIDKKYFAAFEEANARADYYEARHLMNCKKYAQSHLLMQRIKDISKKYAFLWLISYIPPLWKIMHSSVIKRKFSTLVTKFGL